MSNGPELTIFYIVQPPKYEIMACNLLASIRKHFPADVQAIGYCPKHMYDELHPAVHKAHELMNSEVRTFDTDGKFEPDYPHGNKLLASLEKRDSKYSMFIDSDVLFVKDNSPQNLIVEGKVSCALATSLIWAEQTIWDTIYGALDMEIPAERYELTRRSKGKVVPYFNSGLVVFPEQDLGQGRFPDVWYDTAQIVDKIEDLDKRRPYLDQMTLPAAIRRAGLDWNILPEEQNFLLGGMLRGKPLPEDRDIYTLHYRNQDILKEVGFLKTARKYLRDATGEKYVRRLAPQVED